MKISKRLISSTTVFLLLMTGCADDKSKNPNEDSSKSDNTSTEELVGETEKGILVYSSHGKYGYDLYRTLKQSDDLAKSDSDVMEEAWDILNNAQWETAQVNMGRPADFRIEITDNGDKEKLITTVYSLWVSPNGENIELVDQSIPAYIQLPKSHSEKLYKLLVDKNLTAHVVKE